MIYFLNRKMSLWKWFERKGVLFLVVFCCLFLCNSSYSPSPRAHLSSPAFGRLFPKLVVISRGI